MRAHPALPRSLIPLVTLIGIILTGCRSSSHPPSAQVSVAVFTCDVTPPISHPLCGGWIKPLVSVDDPLLAKGIILSHGSSRYVICAVDWCLLQTGAHQLFLSKLATAADVPQSHVTVHTVHQHNAPIADADAQHLLDTVPDPPLHLDLPFLNLVTDQLAATARRATARLRPATRVGFGRARVNQFASNRRVRLADGNIHVRYSATTDPALQSAPEGLIDPWLRTVTLFDGPQPIVRLHYYASHPMSFYGDGRATADTVGLARQQLELEEGVPQIYFTGCAGNVTAGKFNDGSPKARLDLTSRIHAAMRSAIATTTVAPLNHLEWKTTNVQFAPRTEPPWSESHNRQVLESINSTTNARLQAALNLAWTERSTTAPDVPISSLRLGPVTLLHLPAESFVEYQLYAQSLRPHDFIAVAAYGESGPGYICCDTALDEGGYEPTMSRVGPPSEFRYKAAIAELISPPFASSVTPFYPDKLRLLTWRDPSGIEHPVQTPADWAHRKTHILQALQDVMGPYPTNTPHPVPDLRVLEESTQPRYVRKKIILSSSPDDHVPAWLLIPHQPAPSAPAPAMLCLHQTTPAGKSEPVGLTGDPNLQYAHELAERGYVVLAPDYPNFGDYQTDPYQRGYQSATMNAIWNHRRAIDLLTSMPEVDPHRIGTIGHSLGGHNALFLAAFEPRIRAVITSCGFNSFFHYQNGNLTGWSHPGYMPTIASDFECDPKQMPFDFTEILAAIAPRPVFISAPVHDHNFPVAGVKDCLAAARPIYQLFGSTDLLAAVHPDCGHEFPSEIRRAAYLWLDHAMH
jgi:pimeloyl-ACP methyl ester carboxylesterase